MTAPIRNLPDDVRKELGLCCHWNNTLRTAGVVPIPAPEPPCFTSDCPDLPSAAAGGWLNLGLFRNLQRVIDFNAEVAHRAFELGMPEQQLNCPQILRALVDQRGLCSPHRVRSVG